jgi:hypothetical protein
MRTKAPSRKELASELGAAQDIWNGIIASVVEQVGSIDQEWRSSKARFGWICLLKQKKRTLLYLTPEEGLVRVAIVLGERAVGLALASDIPSGIKTLIRDARPYAEGRGIRLPVSSAGDVLVVRALVVIKTTPR